jgi:hypothetical protein
MTRIQLNAGLKVNQSQVGLREMTVARCQCQPYPLCQDVRYCETGSPVRQVVAEKFSNVK